MKKLKIGSNAIANCPMSINVKRQIQANIINQENFKQMTVQTDRDFRKKL